ncbi:hypothetical protein Bbelb_272390 [Branchiostoma belcheri]|nr:hypothetical protein Bbelb_272390 [Branchiostoma belcheri]
MASCGAHRNCSLLTMAGSEKAVYKRGKLFVALISYLYVIVSGGRGGILCSATINAPNYATGFPGESAAVQVPSVEGDFKVLPKLLKITSTNPIKTFLQNPWKYKNLSEAYFSFCKVTWDGTRNHLAFDLGYPTEGADDMEAAERYIKELEYDMTLVLLLEHLDESLVLLRRLMCWEMQDVLYDTAPKNVKNYSYKSYNPTPEELANLRRWKAVDYRLYDTFNRSLWRKIAGQGPDFYRELHHYRELKQNISWFCHGEQHRKSNLTLTVKTSQWSPQFVVDARYCKEIATTECEEAVSRDMKRVADWLNDSKLILHPDKTKAARIITGYKLQDHVPVHTLLAEAGLESVSKRLETVSLATVYKSVRGKAPQYMSALFKWMSPPSLRANTRSAAKRLRDYDPHQLHCPSARVAAYRVIGHDEGNTTEGIIQSGQTAQNSHREPVELGGGKTTSALKRVRPDHDRHWTEILAISPLANASILEDLQKADVVFSVGPLMHDDYTHELKQGKLQQLEFLPKPSGIFIEANMEPPKEANTRYRVILSIGKKELCEKMGRADVVLMPSRSEPFGLVGLEAIAAGVPTVISSKSGLAEFLNARHDIELDEDFKRPIVEFSGNDEEDAARLASRIKEILKRRGPAAKRLKQKLKNSEY